MAQLDILSYFTQLFWLTIVISFFYITIVKKILPEITKIYKVRTLTNKLDSSVLTNTVAPEIKHITLQNNVVEISKLSINLITENLKKKTSEINKLYINNVTKLLLENK